jgi:hypothetical protein
MENIWTPVAKTKNSDILYYSKEIENKGDFDIASVD